MTAGGGVETVRLEPAAVPLPLLGSLPAEACSVDEDCITCGDVAVPLTVISVNDLDAVCVDDAGNTETVAIELVSEVVPGDRVLVHAKVALEKLGDR